MQLVTLLVRKELLLKRLRPLVTVFEILCPVALCASLIFGSSAATTNHYNSSSFAPEDFNEVLASLGPQVQLPLLAEGGALSTGAYAGGLPSIPVPGAVPPLWDYLYWANTTHQAPYDAANSTLAEDKAVDLYVLERAVTAAHPDQKGVFEAILAAYKAASRQWCPTLNRFADVRARGRKRAMVG